MVLVVLREGGGTPVVGRDVVLMLLAQGALATRNIYSYRGIKKLSLFTMAKKWKLTHGGWRSTESGPAERTAAAPPY
jgi:hypothetical protein